MNETSNNWLTSNPCITTSPISQYIDSGIYSGTFPGTNSTYFSNYTSNLNSNNMKTTQVKVAVFTITRDKDTNEINSTKFLKELWVEQKNGASIDLVVAKQLDKDFDPETTVIKTLDIISF